MLLRINTHGGSEVWKPAASEFVVQGFVIKQGFLYVGEKMPAPDQSGAPDAALVNPRLNACSCDFDNEGKNLSYWPSYSEIPPASRGAYLNWLANGRKDENIGIGYVFLYFYGLERRLLHDAVKQDVPKQEIIDIINEIIRLMTIYSEKSRSFRNYASSLLNIAMILHFPDEADAVPIELLSESYDYPALLKWRLGQLAKQGEPIPFKWAFLWYMSCPDKTLRKAAQRCPNEFKTLFETKYQERFGSGMIVPLNKTKLKINYRPASQSLMYGNVFGEVKSDYADLTVISGPINKLGQIAEECYKELDSFSRYLGSYPDKYNSVYAQFLLPKILLQRTNSQVFTALKNKLCDQEIMERGLKLIPVKTLLAEIELGGSDQLAKNDILTIVEVLAKMDLGIEPDIRFCSIKMTTEQRACIFRINSPKPDEDNVRHYLRLLLRLGVIIAEADENVSSQEVDFLTNMIENSKLSDDDRIRFYAFLEFLFNNDTGISDLKTKLAALDGQQQNVIGNAMLELLHADGVVAPSEIIQLEKIYKMLGLDSSRIISQIHNFQAAAQEPVLVQAATGNNAFAIPPSNTKGSKIQLSQEQISKKTRETKEVCKILSSIFDTDEDEPSSAPVVTVIKGLDWAHSKLFNEIIRKEEWARSELEKLCNPLSLMPDGALEILNEFAYATAGNPMIDGDDPIYIDLEIAKEIL